MWRQACALAAMAIAATTVARAQTVPSTYTLIGKPESLIAVIPVPQPVLIVSLNPTPLPLVPAPGSGLNLTDPSMPVYFYPANPTFEIGDFSFDIEQVLNIGSGGGARSGKITFNPFQTGQSGLSPTVIGKFELVDAAGATLETINVDIMGINPGSLTATIPSSPPCGGIPCAFESLSFTSVGPDPVVSFSVTSGSTGFTFSAVPEASTWGMMLIGFVGLGFAGRRRSIKASVCG